MPRVMRHHEKFVVALFFKFTFFHVKIICRRNRQNKSPVTCSHRYFCVLPCREFRVAPLYCSGMPYICLLHFLFPVILVYFRFWWLNRSYHIDLRLMIAGLNGHWCTGKNQNIFPSCCFHMPALLFALYASPI